MVGAERGNSLKHCALSREPLREPKHLDPPGSRSRGERRRKSLRRGIALWHADTLARARARPRVWLIGLSVAEPDPMVARGAIKRFWHDFRDAYGRRPYFSWAELQRRGAIHYHAIVVGPPWRRARDARRWVQRHWPLASIQPSVEERDWRWFAEKGGAYVRKYASDKWQPRSASRGAGVPDKSYQQEYDDLPREIRTWESSRRQYAEAELRQHMDAWDIVNTNPFAPWPIKRLHWWCIARVRHVTPPRSPCTIGRNKAPPAHQPTGGADTEDADDTTIRGSGPVVTPTRRAYQTSF